MKKFFKILMVLALLSGAALSCTKDYSKEIADVQKQNQDLQALVASLQNALNSTNATVSQLTSTSDKQAADIAALASANAEAFAAIVADHADDVAYLEGLIADLKAAGAADLAAAVEELEAAIAAGDEKAAAATEEKIAAAIKACDEKAAEALASAVTTCKEDIAKLKEALEGKISALETTLTAALDAKAKELKKEIETVDGKATANAAAIAEIDKTLEGIAATLDAYKTDIEANKTAIAANKTAIEAAQKDIEAIKEKIAKLSARLTNIVAAPAKDVEIQSFKWKTFERTTVNMNFVVAPASAAELVADGFKNKEVNVTLYINSGRTRTAEPDTCDYVIIPDKVEAKDGIITISAVEDTTFGTISADGWSYYATLVVSGEDKAGEWERVSEPVKPIFGGSAEVTYAWYANDKAMTATEETQISGSGAEKLGAKDSVALGSDGILYIVKKDWDWKSEQLTIKNIINGYSPIIVVGNVAYSSNDFKKAFGLDTLNIDPRFVDLKQTFTEPYEWGGDTPASATKADSALFMAKSSAIYAVYEHGLTINLPEKEEDQIEVVGKATKFEAKKIAFGKIDTCGLGICFVQRIGKHVEEEEATEAQTVKFGINGTPAQAAKATATFTPVEWLTTSILGNMGQANIYDAEDKSVEGASVSVESISGSSKFVKIDVANVPYAAEEQALKIKWASDTKQNTKRVVVLEHGDYIDLTVEKYHGTVNKTTEVKDFYLSRKTGKATITTDITVKNIFSDINAWLIKEAKTASDSEIVYTWFKDHKFADAKYTVKQDNADAGTAQLKIVNDTICVSFDKNGKKLVEGKPVIITVKDTIDGVIAFNYNVQFTPIKPEVAIATIPGFVQNDQIRVEGKIVGDKYVINDINLAYYFKFKDVDKKHSDDIVTVKFSDDTTGIVYSKEDSTYALSGKDALPADAKIKWDDLKATSFKLTAQAFVQGEKSGTPVTVTVWTDDPILEISPVKIDSTLGGKAAEFDLLKNLKISAAAEPTTNIYKNKLDVYGGEVSVNKSNKSDWNCTVNGEEWTTDQMENLFTFENDKLTYKAHDAVGTVVITIPYKFTYNLGEKKFNVVLTIK